ncbi:hypothetical protein VKT23_014715 [Stygiomarasmius scandens]|uniref:Uncharacterized protein n=1 Tax=Marasmiellus scandens TaxID=2682957 RepID=A0ABR1IZN1_9AGAR
MPSKIEGSVAKGLPTLLAPDSFLLSGRSFSAVHPPSRRYFLYEEPKSDTNKPRDKEESEVWWWDTKMERKYPYLSCVGGNCAPLRLKHVRGSRPTAGKLSLLAMIVNLHSKLQFWVSYYGLGSSQSTEAKKVRKVKSRPVPKGWDLKSLEELAEDVDTLMDLIFHT